MKPSLFAALFATILLFHPLSGATQQSALPAPVEGIEWRAGNAIEGGLVLARAAPGVRLELDGVPLPQDDSGHALIGFHRDSDMPVTLTALHPDGRRSSVTMMAVQRDYAVQRIDGLKRDHVTPPQEVLDRIGADSAAVRTARGIIDAGPGAGDFLDGFDMPVEGLITGVYGSQRILNGEPRQPHTGSTSPRRAARRCWRRRQDASRLSATSTSPAGRS